jgi:hypothetical protein
VVGIDWLKNVAVNGLPESDLVDSALQKSASMPEVDRHRESRSEPPNDRGRDRLFLLIRNKL